MKLIIFFWWIVLMMLCIRQLNKFVRAKLRCVYDK
jgi:hypothetical protein